MVINEDTYRGPSPMDQWLRLRRPTQGVEVRFLIRELRFPCALGPKEAPKDIIQALL